MKQRMDFIKQLELIPGLQTVETDDPLKLILRVEGYSGFDIQKRLEAEGIYGEIADPYQVLFVLPLLKVESTYPFDEICEKIKTAVACLNELDRIISVVEVPPLLGEGAFPSRLHVRGSRTYGSGVDSVYRVLGRVAAASIIPYPPGIPLLIAGEIVKDEHVQTLGKLLQMGAKFQGEIRINEKQIVVVKNRVEE